ncbi:MAG TPA: bile acid:sodium symporter family protein [Ohtaekwangia sp.]|uniref:bile acid:sodium symporter family protein n=1 Tax=Ohtaekwangia sp. TaxID=2066019 RepID=UPI002F925E27
MEKNKEGHAFRLHPKQVLERIGLDGFVLALLGMIGLAYIWPQGGIAEGAFSLSSLANYGVSLIFFFYGLRLSKKKLKEGLGNWKLHILVQLSTFILFPLLVLPFKGMFSDTSVQVLWLGTFFLASLPSTVSSSVVMVSLAEGNIPAAIFNASISSIIGVFITPIWMGLILSGSSGDMEMGSIILKLIAQVLLPVVLGILLNPVWGAFADKYKKQLKYFDQTIILVIVYTAFCESFEKKMFSDLTGIELLLLGASMLILFFAAYGITTLICRLLKFDRADRVTAVFCGSKKSLVHGTVMSRVLFSQSTMTGMLLLPLMMYHALQLIVVSMIARKMVKNIHTSDKPIAAIVPNT